MSTSVTAPPKIRYLLHGLVLVQYVLFVMYRDCVRLVCTFISKNNAMCTSVTAHFTEKDILVTWSGTRTVHVSFVMYSIGTVSVSFVRSYRLLFDRRKQILTNDTNISTNETNITRNSTTNDTQGFTNETSI